MSADRSGNQRRYRGRRLEHPPTRPTWRCRDCGIAWPCSAAKLRLLGRYRENRPALLAHLVTLREEAAGHLVGLGHPVPEDVLDRRFLTWADPPD
ncbi:flavin reductase [Micromonospora fluostatini]|uniref:flavin reductase n=1 Tax=Micromonospora sp. JCM 30529 TaxID=3421643 RepID=UPI003D17332A